ncbi:MAG: phenylalanine 4-monooxygenase [Gammaproteobacteria bacterium]|nr:phenylalanine 4-monooxygenase [Gammaproteobacteria bacterium]
MTKYIAKKPDAKGNINFTAEENATWQILIERQMQTIQNRACDAYLTGLENLNLPTDRIPQCSEISSVLKASTGWSVVPVDTLIPLEQFYTLLANRQFPAASFIRIREELDYLQEPDIFHEFFGHCPMLTNQAYADFVQWYGQNALTVSKKAQSLLGRLFWFTVEFGLINTAKGARIYGGGILSSHAETIFALESHEPERFAFDVNKILHMPYRYDQIQKCYFTINDLTELYQLKTEKIIKHVEGMVDGTTDSDFIIC